MNSCYSYQVRNIFLNFSDNGGNPKKLQINNKHNGIKAQLVLLRNIEVKYMINVFNVKKNSQLFHGNAN